MISLGLEIGHNRYINTMLFAADDQVIMEGPGGKLQLSVYKLYQVLLTIWKYCWKPKAFSGSYQIRTKIVINSTAVEQVSHCQYLGSSISYEEETDMNNKLNRFQHICETIYKALKHVTLKETLLKFWKVLAVPKELLYGPECWVLRKTNLQQLEAS